jgi:hypothetical protein
MYEDVSATGARFTAVGVVTPDPASVESVLGWANRLQDRAHYLVVQNATSPQADFRPMGMTTRKTTISTARKGWSWFIVLYHLCAQL